MASELMNPCGGVQRVDGPLADAIDIDATYNAMGQGCLANAAICQAH